MTKVGDWIPAGPDWRERSGASAATGIAGVRIATADPMAMAGSLGAVARCPSFVRGGAHLCVEGLSNCLRPPREVTDWWPSISTAAEEPRVGECHMIAGTEFRLVTTPPVWSH